MGRRGERDVLSSPLTLTPTSLLAAPRAEAAASLLQQTNVSLKFC